MCSRCKWYGLHRDQKLVMPRLGNLMPARMLDKYYHFLQVQLGNTALENQVNNEGTSFNFFMNLSHHLRKFKYHTKQGFTSFNVQLTLGHRGVRGTDLQSSRKSS